LHRGKFKRLGCERGGEDRASSGILDEDHGSLIVLGIFTVFWTIGTVTAEASSQSGSIWERLIHQVAFANGKDGGAK